MSGMAREHPFAGTGSPGRTRFVAPGQAAPRAAETFSCNATVGSCPAHSSHGFHLPANRFRIAGTTNRRLRKPHPPQMGRPELAPLGLFEAHEHAADGQPLVGRPPGGETKGTSAEVSLLAFIGVPRRDAASGSSTRVRCIFPRRSSAGEHSGPGFDHDHGAIAAAKWQGLSAMPGWILRQWKPRPLAAQGPPRNGIVCQTASCLSDPVHTELGRGLRNGPRSGPFGDLRLAAPFIARCQRQRREGSEEKSSRA